MVAAKPMTREILSIVAALVAANMASLQAAPVPLPNIKNYRIDLVVVPSDVVVKGLPFIAQVNAITPRPLTDHQAESKLPIDLGPRHPSQGEHHRHRPSGDGAARGFRRR